ncbi:FAD:protein FMN transferase [Tessaracoccus antarcticus]|uniref:FAD:protein FMN transferase n=1 Tax=Tessaracoccus antarcticus TaxID=2479848 RepID=A0A3M0GJ28_9ACTN|nr:FAD:protein FMN transferase [Tessaracoccus antarcticus]RMB61623.1 FAD:protein FMN transferase [Tessaracoccus antarcticus]
MSQRNTMNEAPHSRRAWVEHHMGMPVSIHLRGNDIDSDAASRAVGAAFATFHAMDEIFSTYAPQSQLMRLRRGEVGIDQCSTRMREALALGEQAEQVTRGAFTTMLPSGDGGLEFDPTGLVKGWTVDLAAEHLAVLPGVSWCINAGGDLRVGAHPNLPRRGEGAIVWNVGIQDPAERTRLVGALALSEGAVATSGTYARGAHLYEPDGGTMIERPGSVTVTGPTLLWADIWATALFVGAARTRGAFATGAPGYAVTMA